MAQPTAYNRAFSFTDYAVANPAEPLPGDEVDAELDAVETTVAGVLTNLALIQDDDGTIKSGGVDLDALATDVVSLMEDATAWNIRGAWVTATLYAVKDVVVQTSRSYLCAEAHTSGTFATDVTAVKWIPITAAAGATGATGAAGATGDTGPAGATGADGIFSAIASQAEATTATDNTKGMTPLRVDQHMLGRAYQGFALFNGYFTASVAGNDLTIALKTLANANPSSSAPIRALMPDETIGTGLPDFLSITSATSLVVPNTATLGTSNAVAATLHVLLFNDGQLGVVNCLSGLNVMPLDEGALYSTTAVSTAADSAQVIYTTSALTSKPFRYLGRIVIEEASAGVWATAPVRIVQAGYGVSMPGAIVQRSYVPKTDTFTGATGGAGAWVTITGLAASLTMRSKANLVTGHAAIQIGATGGVDTKLARVSRASTAVAPVGDAASNRTVCSAYSDDANEPCQLSMRFCEAPNSASSLTYQVDATLDVSDNVVVNSKGDTDTDSAGFPRGASWIYVEEIQT